MGIFDFLKKKKSSEEVLEKISFEDINKLVVKKKQEIEDNQNKYIIDIKYLDNPNDLRIINEIITEIGLSFSVDEVAELFALDTDDIEKQTLQLNR